MTSRSDNGRRSVIASSVAIGLLPLLGGCGGQHPRQPAPSQSPGATSASTTPTAGQAQTKTSSAARRAPTGRLLVYFKRTIGFDPMASQLKIYANGSAVTVTTLGGRNGAKVNTFEMPATRLRRLRSLIAHTPLRTTRCCDTGLYVYWVIAGQRSSRLQQGTIPRASRPLIAQLNALTDKHTNY
jgi:hypothetical protein